MGTPRVVITGIGLVTPLGIGVAENWYKILAGQSGITQLCPEHLPAKHQHVFTKLPSHVIGAVDEQALATAKTNVFWARSGLSRQEEFVEVAATEALQQASFLSSSQKELDEDVTEGPRGHAGVCIGCGMSGVAGIAQGALQIAAGKPRSISPYFVPSVLNNMPAGAVSIRRSFRGPNLSASTACASGAHSIGEALWLLRSRQCTRVVAGATDACVDAVSLAGFSRMRALSTAHNGTPETASRPFDRDRDGFVLAEGAGILVMETLENALQRGQQPVAEVVGFGASADAHHIAQPPPDGAGAALAMQRALQDSQLSASHVAYVNAHATSTPMGDSAELQAIKTVFGEKRVQEGADLAISSTKGATGHVLGAAGAVEVAFTALALQSQQCPPGTNLFQPDDENLKSLVLHGAVNQLKGRGAAICNSFGFGGTNACVVLAPYR